jgi:hypothetical protein
MHLSVPSSGEVSNFLLEDFEAATINSQADNGEELEEKVVSNGVIFKNGKPNLAGGWYSGYFRVASNEKHVVRSHNFSELFGTRRIIIMSFL